jgi:hypothetical protein
LAQTAIRGYVRTWSPADIALLPSTPAFGTGRTNILYGFVYLIVAATYILLIFLP